MPHPPAFCASYPLPHAFLPVSLTSARPFSLASTPRRPRASTTAGMEPIGDLEFAEIAAYTPTPDAPYLLSPGEHVVSLEKPLGLELKAARSGAVYVSALVAGGNAETDGGVALGDVVTCCSVPFGDALMSVPKVKGVEFVAGQMQTRAEDEGGFLLCLLRTEGAWEAFLEEEEGDGAERNSIELLPVMKEIWNRDYFVLLTPERRREFEKAEEEAAEVQAKAMGLSDNVFQGDDGNGNKMAGTEGGEDDRLFHVSGEVEREMERHLEERMKKYRDGGG